MELLCISGDEESIDINPKVDFKSIVDAKLRDTEVNKCDQGYLVKKMIW